MTELSIHNNRVIILDTDKIYSIGTKNMIKLKCGNFVSKKVIKNPKNKLTYRHIFSYLNQESIDCILEQVWKHKFSIEVLKIGRMVDWRINPWESSDIVSEVYECGTNYKYLNGYNYELQEQKRQIHNKEEWVMVDILKTDMFDTKSCVLGEDRVFKMKTKQKFFNKIRTENIGSKSLQKQMDKYNKQFNKCVDYFKMSDYCCGLTSKGELCGITAYSCVEVNRECYNELFNDKMCEDSLDQEETFTYHNRRSRSGRQLRTKFSLCRRHYTKYESMDMKNRSKELTKIYGKMGYKMSNGYMCKICK